MQQLTKRFAAPLFFIVMLLYVAGGLFDQQMLQIVTKPLLMPILIALLLAATRSSRARNLFILALVFSFAGDVFLLFEFANPALFVPGLLCFLITHILYIVYFVNIKPARISLLKTAPWLWPLLLLYVGGLLYLLYPGLGALKIPVTVYALVITGMLLASLHIYKRVNPTAGKHFILGALLFVISDSLLAVNKFYAVLPFSFLVMVTYCFAQYFLVKGFIRHARK